jgi:superfamily I DNA and/or RNA helicase
VTAYQSREVQAGVIVPYRKQAEAIRRELRQRGGAWDEDALASRIATVDSFQGREQDVILFGFTRSNPDGRVGFLSEIRRLNVSLTRARRQLVLVGDSVTLSNALDPDFARLFTALLLRVKKTPGSYLSSHEVMRITKS